MELIKKHKLTIIAIFTTIVVALSLGLGLGLGLKNSSEIPVETNRVYYYGTESDYQENIVYYTTEMVFDSNNIKEFIFDQTMDAIQGYTMTLATDVDKLIEAWHSGEIMIIQPIGTIDYYADWIWNKEVRFCTVNEIDPYYPKWTIHATYGYYLTNYPQSGTSIIDDSYCFDFWGH